MTQPPPGNMNVPDVIDKDLPPTTDGILSECPRFRILLIGKSGVGKSSLVNKIFKVDIASVSHEHSGKSDINKELAWDTNPRFVLHDSEGFEAGEINNLDKVKTFVKERMQMPDLKDRLHAIWLCMPTPTSGGRVFEKGDEAFLKFIGRSVPIIAVFTKYDMLVYHTENTADDDATDQDIEESSRLNFEQLCIRPLKEAMGVTESPPYIKVSVKPKHEKTIEELVKTTQEHVSKFISGIDQQTSTTQKKRRTSSPRDSPDVYPVIKRPPESPTMEISLPTVIITTQEQSQDISIVWAMAQRSGAELKISASIDVGAKNYWKEISANSKFKGKTLEKCLHTIHRDIVTVWNFSDPEKLLDSELFKAMMTQLVPESAGPSTSSNLFSQVGRSVAVKLGSWTAKIWHSAPGPRASLTGYILHITNVMQHIFYRILGIEHVSWTVVEDAVDAYSRSKTRMLVDASVSEYFTRERKITEDRVLDEMVRLIDLYRFDPQRDQALEVA